MEYEEVINATIMKYEQYINPSTARLFRFMGLGTIEWRAEGSRIYDIAGKEYIDCIGGYGVFSLGHRHPRVIEAVKKQLDIMPLSGKVFFNKQMADLAEKLSNIMPGDLQYSFFGNSGTEAVEGAIKLAKVHTGKPKIISTINAFHGKTLGALSATGRDMFCEPFKPLMKDFEHVLFGDIHSLELAIDKNTAAIIVEPIQGEGGIIIPPDNYLSDVRRICDKNNIVMICDEVQTGLARTGKMFAVDHYGIVPDIITTAKALGGGVMPIGAFTARPHLWDKYIQSPFLHTSTFGGNSLACIAGSTAIDVILEEKLVDEAATKGDVFIKGLKSIAKDYPHVIKEVRGRGLMIGLELTKEGIGGFMMSELINRGILVAYTLNNPKVIRIEPPLVMSQNDIFYILESIKDAVIQAEQILEDLSEEQARAAL